jgi:hypothetical protein
MDFKNVKYLRIQNDQKQSSGLRPALDMVQLSGCCFISQFGQLAGLLHSLPGQKEVRFKTFHAILI